jgi:hypothetical protein
MRHRWTIILVAAACVLACSPAKDDQPETPPPSSTTAERDDGFPDLSNYTDDTSGSYEVTNVPRVQGFSFSAANGLICANNAYPDVEYEMVGCRGPMTHEGPGDWSVVARRSQQATIESITSDPDYAADIKDPPPVLPPFHKLLAAKGDAVCAVDDKGTVACRVGDHGFVLTPTSTKLFYLRERLAGNSAALVRSRLGSAIIPVITVSRNS